MALSILLHLPASKMFLYCRLPESENILHQFEGRCYSKRSVRTGSDMRITPRTEAEVDECSDLSFKDTRVRDHLLLVTAASPFLTVFSLSV